MSSLFVAIRGQHDDETARYLKKKSYHDQDTQSVSLSDEPDPGFDQIQDSMFT